MGILKGLINNGEWRMNMRFRTMAEVLGLVGIVGSMGFVGVEIRQNTQATRAETVQSVMDGWREWNLHSASIEQGELLNQIYDFDNPDDAPFPLQQAIQGFYRALWTNWQNIQYHHSVGNWPEGWWNAVLADMSDEGAEDQTAESLVNWRRISLWAWEQNGFRFSGSFQELFDSVSQDW